MSAKWYVLQVYTGFENKVASEIESKLAKESLDKFVDQVVVAEREVFTIRRGKKVTVKKNFLPGYIFIKMSNKDEVMALIRNLPRVSSFLGSDKNFVPKPITDSEVEKILSQIQEKADTVERATSSFNVGERVSISDGPFASFGGVVEDVDSIKHKLKISVSIFERMVSVEADFNQVQKI